MNYAALEYTNLMLRLPLLLPYVMALFAVSFHNVLVWEKPDSEGRRPPSLFAAQNQANVASACLVGALERPPSPYQLSLDKFPSQADSGVAIKPFSSVVSQC